MLVFKSTFPDRKGKTTKTSNWYIEFQDHRGITRRIAAYTSKSASEELGRKIDRAVGSLRITAAFDPREGGFGPASVACLVRDGAPNAMRGAA